MKLGRDAEVELVLGGGRQHVARCATASHDLSPCVKVGLGSGDGGEGVWQRVEE